MNVYVETNFVLELVFEQEQWFVCEQILTACQEASNFELIIPAYCLAEPNEKLRRQAGQREELQKNLSIEMRQLSRSQSYSERISRVAEISSLLAQSTADERERFDFYRNRILHIAQVIPLTSDVLRQSAFYEQQYKLTPQDALVYTSVILHLAAKTPMNCCFLNKNAKDFSKPSMIEELESYQCKMIPRFDQGLEFIQAA